VPNEAFLDAGHAIALAATSDQLHERALVIADQLEANQRGILTTRAVLLEIGNALSKQRYRSAAVRLLSSLASDPTVEVVSLTDDLYEEGLRLFRGRPDKDWSLCDCVSFVVMESRGLIDALSADEHFEQAGFRALLRES
jgi:predicted nucleic acid-binding protein